MLNPIVVLNDETGAFVLTHDISIVHRQTADTTEIVTTNGTCLTTGLSVAEVRRRMLAAPEPAAPQNPQEQLEAALTALGVHFQVYPDNTGAKLVSFEVDAPNMEVPHGNDPMPILVNFAFDAEGSFVNAQAF